MIVTRPNLLPSPTLGQQKSSMDTKLRGQVAIVTGSSSGIGRGCAIALGREGVRVVVTYHSDEDGAAATVEEIRSAGGEAFYVQANVAEEDSVEQLFATTLERYRALDILVNNAGMQKDAPLVEMTLDDWNAVIKTDLTGQFLCARAAARQFIKQGVRREVSRAAGKIIGMSSVHDAIPWAGHVNYAAAKGGVKLLIETLAQELAEHRIRVNSISPGAIRTDINRAAWEKPEDMQELLTKIPYQRIGETEDVGNLCVFLASDLSDYITGATIYIDGGMMLYPGFREGG